MEDILDGNGRCVLCVYPAVSFTYIITYWGHTFGVRVETDFRHDLFQHIQELSYAYFDNARVGQLMSQLTSELLILRNLHITHRRIFYIDSNDHWCADHYVYDSVETGTGDRSDDSDFLLVVWKCRFSMQNASRNVKKRDGIYQYRFLNPDFPDFVQRRLLQTRKRNLINSTPRI